jgi:hypothetical protein
LLLLLLRLASAQGHFKLLEKEALIVLEALGR